MTTLTLWLMLTPVLPARVVWLRRRRQVPGRHRADTDRPSWSQVAAGHTSFLEAPGRAGREAAGLTSGSSSAPALSGSTDSTGAGEGAGSARPGGNHHPEVT